jgi:hypothetical protein
VKEWAKANGVAVIYCTAGQRKHEIAEEYLAARLSGVGSTRPGPTTTRAAEDTGAGDRYLDQTDGGDAVALRDGAITSMLLLAATAES